MGMGMKEVCGGRDRGRGSGGGGGGGGFELFSFQSVKWNDMK